MTRKRKQQDDDNISSIEVKDMGQESPKQQEGRDAGAEDVVEPTWGGMKMSNLPTSRDDDENDSSLGEWWRETRVLQRMGAAIRDSFTTLSLLIPTRPSMKSRRIKRRGRKHAPLGRSDSESNVGQEESFAEDLVDPCLQRRAPIHCLTSAAQRMLATGYQKWIKYPVVEWSFSQLDNKFDYGYDEYYIDIPEWKARPGDPDMPSCKVNAYGISAYSRRGRFQKSVDPIQLAERSSVSTLVREAITEWIMSGSYQGLCRVLNELAKKSPLLRKLFEALPMGTATTTGTDDVMQGPMVSREKGLKEDEMLRQGHYGLPRYLRPGRKDRGNIRSHLYSERGRSGESLKMSEGKKGIDAFIPKIILPGTKSRKKVRGGFNRARKVEKAERRKKVRRRLMPVDAKSRRENSL
ncbi:hypothetical protein BG011_007844 [Mortierella polycephala]|uniref:Uncharacterized protein n=1 Tax=Mortierella polycephala TaxID=41804 RepID=A0A9P6QB38_9FUNG|nr:hypothetical protein BG011_007844 [Mortierella polycephala]